MTASTPLSPDAICRLVGEIFVYDMPFNQALGLKLAKLETDCAELRFTHQPSLVGNAAQQILHGGVIASVLDVAAGLVCVNHAFTRHADLTEAGLRQHLSRMGTVDLRVDYLRPGRGEHFIATSSLIRGGNKISVARVELHNEGGVHLASATATYLVG